MRPLLDAKTAIVAHDAGAANIIVAWLSEASAREIGAVMRGPAERIWQERFPDIGLARDLDTAIQGAHRIVTGTGWQSDLEHGARVAVAQSGKASVAVIDHWVNYRERFVRDAVEQLPDEIWVTDDYALRMGRDAFPPGMKIEQFENTYLANTVRKVRDIDRDAKDILYIAEPILALWDDRAGGEFQALDYFLAHRSRLDIDPALPIRIRLHPSEPKDKYDKWIAAQRAPVVVDREPDLAHAIAGARWVAGCHSYAMVVALEAGRRVVSTLPPWAPPCPLPHDEIIHLRNME